MSQSNKQVINRTRHRVRLINFNDSIIEGYVFVSHGGRITDLLNDDRGFIPVESASGEVKVISKRAIMEIEILETPKVTKSNDNVVNIISGNAYELLGVAPDADDSVVRAVYLDRMQSVDPDVVAQLTSNPDLVAAAETLRTRYTAAYDAISHTRQIEAIAVAVKAAQPKRSRFGSE